MEPEKAPKQESMTRAGAYAEVRFQNNLEIELEDKKRNLKDVHDEIHEQEAELSALNSNRDKIVRKEYYDENEDKKLLKIEEDIEETKANIEKLKHTENILRHEIKDLEDKEKNT